MASATGQGWEVGGGGGWRGGLEIGASNKAARERSICKGTPSTILAPSRAGRASWQTHGALLLQHLQQRFVRTRPAKWTRSGSLCSDAGPRASGSGRGLLRGSCEATCKAPEGKLLEFAVQGRGHPSKLIKGCDE